MITVHILEWMRDLTTEGKDTPMEQIEWRHFKPEVESQLLLCSQSTTIPRHSHMVLLLKQDCPEMRVMLDTDSPYVGTYRCTPDSLNMMIRLGQAACRSYEIVDRRVTSG